MSFENIPFPTGQTNQQLYSWGANLSTQLRRILQEVASGEDGDITELQQAVEDLQATTEPLTPQFYSEHALITASANVRNSLAEVANRQATQLEQNAAATIKAAIEAHRASTGIRTQLSVNNGFAEQITSLTASVGVTEANVTALTQVVADGDQALATQIGTVETTVAGNTASIEEVSTSVDGIATRYGVYLNAQNEVIGAIQLDGTPLGSTFTVAVDNFRVSKAGETGGDAVPIFAIQTVGETAKIALVADMFADGSITARSLDVETLSAISANIGTVTAGLIRDAADDIRFDLDNMRIYRTDGMMDMDFKNIRFRMGSEA